MSKLHKIVATTAFVGTVAVGGSQIADADTYTIKSGDTLWDIAVNNGTTVDALMQDNNLSSHLIYPGDKLNYSSSSSSSSTTRKRHFSSGSRHNSNYNSYNNEDYKKKYMNYLNNNYRTIGFFTRSSIVNGMLWGLLFNSLSTHSFANASNEQKELAENIKASKVPVYMIEVKTKNGETKYATVTKEQYDKIKEGDEISLKNGNLEIKSSKQ